MAPVCCDLSQHGCVIRESSSLEPQMRAPVWDHLCEKPQMGLVCSSPCFHFEQQCRQMKTNKETYLDRLYYYGRLVYPPPPDRDRLGSQKKRRFREILVVCCHRQ